jgi:GNAT superfamily N-acetyltransferase
MNGDQVPQDKRPFGLAWAIACYRQANTLELRAALSLSSLCQRQGRRAALLLLSGGCSDMVECRRMTEESLTDAFGLLHVFLGQDAHYLNSSHAYGDGGSAALSAALKLFLHRPELGFVWLAYEGHEPVAVCVVCFAISTSIGAVVAKLDDVYVISGKQGQGIGSAHLNQLKAELGKLGVRRIDTSVHLQNGHARRFYERHGFMPLNEERLACVL